MSTAHSKTNLKKANTYDTINKKLNYLEDDDRFKIQDILSDSLIIMASPPFDNDADKSIYYNELRYKISKDDFEAKKEDATQYDLPDRINIGILTLPFKFRGQDEKSFEAEFNLNSTLAYRFFSLGGGHLFGQIGAGIGGAELNDVNAKGIIDKATIKANALSMLAGVMIQYKKVQAGIYIGTDYINNQTFYQWRYQGKPWFAFGVGYQLFNVGLGKGNQEKQ